MEVINYAANFNHHRCNCRGNHTVHTAATTPVDAIEEIKKYKMLMEDGVISQQEFEVKKSSCLEFEKLQYLRST